MSRLEQAVYRLSVLPRPARVFIIGKLRAFVNALAWQQVLEAPQWEVPTGVGDGERFDRWLRTGQRQWVFAQ